MDIESVVNSLHGNVGFRGSAQPTVKRFVRQSATRQGHRRGGVDFEISIVKSRKLKQGNNLTFKVHLQDCFSNSKSSLITVDDVLTTIGKQFTIFPGVTGEVLVV